MGNQSRWAGIAGGVVMGVLLSAVVVLAGNLEPSVGPTEAGSQMYNLDQVYNRINNGTAANKVTTLTGPSSGPSAGTKHTLDEIYDLAGLRATVPKTGQINCYDSTGAAVSCAGTGQDGQIRAGVVWPTPRFTDNNNGTVTDNLTGLIWPKNANCLDTVGGINKSLGTLNWADALAWSNSLAAGRCGLTDGSTAGQWRLPNVREMQSLIDYGFYNPALSNTSGLGQWTEGAPFTGVQEFYYWSSTTILVVTVDAWIVSLFNGYVFHGNKTFTYFVWPVRGGQYLQIYLPLVLKPS
jgi:hypothetical protein